MHYNLFKVLIFTQSFKTYQHAKIHQVPEKLFSNIGSRVKVPRIIRNLCKTIFSCDSNVITAQAWFVNPRDYKEENRSFQVFR